MSSDMSWTIAHDFSKSFTVDQVFLYIDMQLPRTAAVIIQRDIFAFFRQLVCLKGVSLMNNKAPPISGCNDNQKHHNLERSQKHRPTSPVTIAQNLSTPFTVNQVFLYCDMKLQGLVLQVLKPRCCPYRDYFRFFRQSPWKVFPEQHGTSSLIFRHSISDERRTPFLVAGFIPIRNIIIKRK